MYELFIKVLQRKMYSEGCFTKAIWNFVLSILDSDKNYLSISHQSSVLTFDTTFKRPVGFRVAGLTNDSLNSLIEFRVKPRIVKVLKNLKKLGNSFIFWNLRFCWFSFDTWFKYLSWLRINYYWNQWDVEILIGFNFSIGIHLIFNYWNGWLKCFTVAALNNIE